MAGLFYFIEMRKARRALSAHGLESLLKPLPWGCLFGRKAEHSPANPTFCEWLAWVFFSAYPEIVRLPALPPAPDETGDLKAVLTAFYTIAQQAGRFALAESFERFARADKRLEAAALERVRDSFYDWDGFRAAEPDWEKTTEKALTLEPLPPLQPLNDLRRTAPVLTTMIFRDGFFVLPVPDVFALAGDGVLWMKKAPVSVRLSPDERRFVNAFYPAFVRRDFKAAAKECLSKGLFQVSSPLELIKALENADDLLAALAPFNPPFRLRLVLKTLDEIPPAKREMNLYANRTIADESPDFETVVTMPETVMQSFSVRGKKPAAFTTDVSEIKAVLLRNEYAERFRPKKRLLLRAFVWLCALLLSLYFLRLV